jgi:arsenate reductase-like glutaredoxin family protein
MKNPCDFLKENWAEVDNLLRLSLYEYVGKGKYGEYRKEVNISFCENASGLISLRHRFAGEQGGKLAGCIAGEKRIGFLHTHVPISGHTFKEPSNNDMTHIYSNTCKTMCIATQFIKENEPYVHVDCWTTKENNTLVQELRNNVKNLNKEVDALITKRSALIRKYGEHGVNYYSLSKEDKETVDEGNKKLDSIRGQRRGFTNLVKKNYEKMTDKCSFDELVFH